MPNETFSLRSAVSASADELYAWHSRPAAFLRLQPPWEQLELATQEGTFGTNGMRVAFRAQAFGPFRRNWQVEFFDFEPGRGFKYRQVKGPFAEWVHTHRFIPDGPHRSFLENEIRYRLPLGPIGCVLWSGMVEDRIRALFAYRHALTASDLRRHGLYRDRPRMTIAITGSRGLIGTELARFLATGGHEVIRLVSGSGNPSRPAFDDGTKYVGWKSMEPVDPAQFDGCDAVIHLAAESISDRRWNEAKRREILESRTVPTRKLAEAIAALPRERRPKVFISASAVG
ncbi:MAG TPA: NAD-dependent epimerase/dehydratase family protein, partial [Urbifossiella sp.]